MNERLCRNTRSKKSDCKEGMAVNGSLERSITTQETLD
jgi:hypothetical protein